MKFLICILIIWGSILQECPVGTFKNVSGSDRALCLPCPPNELPRRATYITVRGILVFYINEGWSLFFCWLDLEAWNSDFLFVPCLYMYIYIYKYVCIYVCNGSLVYICFSIFLKVRKVVSMQNIGKKIYLFFLFTAKKKFLFFFGVESCWLHRRKT